MRKLLLALLAPLLAATLGLAKDAKDGRPVDYVLQPLDLIRIIVFQEPDLERQVRISQEYTVNLPLIGQVNLSGRSVRQAEELIGQLYDKDYLRNPQITITVLEYTPRTVQVLGAVNQPGSIAFTPEQQMGLVEAIARAGGQARIADLRRVRLTRIRPDGTRDTVTINVDDIMKGNGSDIWLLQKDDVIFVPERIL
jgi:polysaccharide biosynthesis/export protein